VRTPPHQATPRRHRPDVNRASTAELAALPGVEPEVAERVVQARAAGGPFASLQDLARRATLKPHELVPFASLADLTASTPPPRGGRVVDF
jgi:competence protein ComEA